MWDSNSITPISRITLNPGVMYFAGVITPITLRDHTSVMTP
jgi:hypothetical protein